jgi:hypothetical protein
MEAASDSRRGGSSGMSVLSRIKCSFTTNDGLSSMLSTFLRVGGGQKGMAGTASGIAVLVVELRALKRVLASIANRRTFPAHTSGKEY